MTTDTSFLKLKTYNLTTDGSALFSTFRYDIAGDTTSSNMYKIDAFASETNGSIVALKANKPIVNVPGVYSVGNYDATGITSITAYSDGLIIILRPDTTNTSDSPSLNINSLGSKPLQKYNSSGAISSVLTKDLVINRGYIFRYDSAISSGVWVMEGAVSMDQISTSGSTNEIIVSSGSILMNSGYKVTDFATTTGSFVVGTLNPSLKGQLVLTSGSFITVTANTSASTIIIATSASKATSAQVATGTDDTNFVTSKAIKDSVNVPNLAPGNSGNTLISSGSVWTSACPAVYQNNTVTLTNKRITPRVGTITSASWPAINTDSYDSVDIIGLATSASMSTNLTGTPTNFQKFIIRLKDDGTPRAINWGSGFASRGGTLPTTTTANKISYIGLIYNSGSAIWDCVAASTEA